MSLYHFSTYIRIQDYHPKKERALVQVSWWALSVAAVRHQAKCEVW